VDDDLTARVTTLEARLDALESGPTAADAVPAGEAGRDQFWALHRLKAEVVPLAGERGALLFTGAVQLPTGKAVEWQEGHAAGALLDEDWSPLAAGLSALAHPIRLLLLQQVLGGARTVAELAAHESLGTTGQLYHHLRQLTGAGWLRASTRGRYEVPPERVVPLLIVLTGVRR